MLIKKQLGKELNMMRILYWLICAFLLCLPVSADLTGAAPVAVDTDAGRQRLYADLIMDFQIFNCLLSDTDAIDSRLYLRAAKDIDEASRILATAFAPELAYGLANYYLNWDAERERVWLTPTESIPAVTADDLSQCSAVPQGKQVIVSCHFWNCYQPGDHWIYEVTLENPADHWIIVALRLEPAA
jgi:hypothetical protein